MAMKKKCHSDLWVTHLGSAETCHIETVSFHLHLSYPWGQKSNSFSARLFDFLWLFGSRTFSKQFPWDAPGGNLWAEPVLLLISAQSMENVSIEALLSQVLLKGTCRDGKGSYMPLTMDQGSPNLSPLFSLVTTLHHHLSGNQRRTWQRKPLPTIYIQGQISEQEESEIWRKTGKAG